MPKLRDNSKITSLFFLPIITRSGDGYLEVAEVILESSPNPYESPRLADPMPRITVARFVQEVFATVLGGMALAVVLTLTLAAVGAIAMLTMYLFLM